MPYQEVHVSITLYTGQNCNRCVILKEFLTSRGQSYTAYDFQEDKEVFNPFYRAHRAALHRDEENRLEIPIYDDGVVVKQGIGEVLAYLLAGEGLSTCVGTTWDLHGWISNINVSSCPGGEEEHFLTMLRLLTKGGLKVILDADGRRPELLEKVLKEGLAARLVLNIFGPAALYPDIVGGPLVLGDLKKSVALARSVKDSVIRILVAPYRNSSCELVRLAPAQAGAAAEFVFEACADRMLPLFIEALPGDGLPELREQDLLPYRAKVRNSLVKAEIRKPKSH